MLPIFITIIPCGAAYRHTYYSPPSNGSSPLVAATLDPSHAPQRTFTFPARRAISLQKLVMDRSSEASHFPSCITSTYTFLTLAVIIAFGVVRRQTLYIVTQTLHVAQLFVQLHVLMPQPLVLVDEFRRAAVESLKLEDEITCSTAEKSLCLKCFGSLSGLAGRVAADGGS